MATYSSVLAWRIPGMGEPGELPSVLLQWDSDRARPLLYAITLYTALAGNGFSGLLVVLLRRRR